jgi:hypothetical protein
MAQVRLYEDIDGCLNAEYNARAWRNAEDVGSVGAGYQRAWVTPRHDDYGERLSEFHTAPKYRLEWNERLIAALNELPVEFVWTTTWREDARAVGKAMKLLHDPQRVLHPLRGFTTFPSIEWKIESILHEQEHDPSPFIAVDDEWDWSPNYRESLEGMGGLVICPDANLGLTPKHIEQMREYINQNS